MNVYTLVIIDEKQEIDIYPCSTVDVANQILEICYRNILQGEIDDGKNITYNFKTNTKRNRKFEIHWGNTTKNENEEIVYPEDDYIEYCIKGYISERHFLTNLDIEHYDK